MSDTVNVRAPYQPISGAPARQKIRVAGLQLSGVEGDFGANLAAVETALRQAAAHGAKIALTPEAFLTGYTDRERTKSSALEVPGPETNRLCALCRELGIYLIVGLVARTPTGGYTNSAALLGPGGCVGLFSKAHINRFEEPIGYTRGDSFPTWDLVVDGTPIRIGIMICYDREVPEAARLLMLQGVDIIFNPLACRCPSEDIHRALIRVRAFENEVFVVMVNHAAPRMNGLSFVAHPSGDIIADAGGEPEVFTCDLDLASLDDWRKNGIYGFHHRRPELYWALVKH